jgi:glutathione S-transferase
LEAGLPKASPGDPAPALTLYRDTNGWCPFCERVWLGLRKKGISYDEVLINLYDKPQWYKDMVPTALVPAVKFEESGEVVWESEEILRQLDARFPEAPPLVADPERVKAAIALSSGVMNASMGLAYRSGNMTEDEVQRQRQVLIAAVDKLDSHLETQGPFLAGKEVSAADCTAVPMLERFEFQLPFSAAALELHDAERWPALARWYDAMRAQPAYQDRVAGDEYSWTAVAPVLMRLFGSQNGTLPKAAEARAVAAEAAATQVLADIASGAGSGVSSPEVARLEAAAKLISNRAAVVADVVNTEPKSQKHLQRLAPDKEGVVEATLREAASALISGRPPQPPECDHTGAPCDAADVAATCSFVAARLCAPRDMGAPAADALRRTLFSIAHAAKQA